MNFLRWIGCALMAVGFAQGAENAARPNILFCIADDWSWPHAGIYGDKVVRTPTFDRIAREGAVFQNAFCAAPSCSPSRAAILTGRAVHQLEEGGNLWGFLPSRFETYPDTLERAGYFVGHIGKGWGPGNFEAGERTRNPAGPMFRSFEGFLSQKPKDKPFCAWVGSRDPHRPYERGTGARSGLKSEDVRVPAFWPDTAEVRGDILDYYFEVERCDREVGALVRLLEERGELDNTVIIFTGDNGWPFPRSKANLYDGGTREPLAIRWPRKIKAGQSIESFVNLQDIAPTILELAGLVPAKEMVGRSLVPLVTGAERDGQRTRVFLERERHANVRQGDLSYPSRAVRTTDFLYIRNLRPERWPAGDAQMWKAVGEFGDCDAGLTKEAILSQRNEPAMKPLFQLCFGLRPAEELYDLRKDPWQTNNVAASPAFASVKEKLRTELEAWRQNTADPRLDPKDERFEKAPYFGDAKRMPQKTVNQ
ncbi:MAG TPA: sulfatase [Methylomirabilota bacterium]|nr:sulfatase [Methylomirabilota bacterium]